jgi:molybdopterin-guanine dinucleotide biosynthesis protein A
LGATAVVTAAVDSPFLPGDLTPRLCMAAETAPEGVAIARSAKDHPTFALWPVSIAPALAAFLDSGANPKVMAFADAHHAARAAFPDETAFQNLNTPEDLARAETLLRSA